MSCDSNSRRRDSAFSFSNLSENNTGLLEYGQRRFDAEQGSRLLLKAYHSYYLNHVEGQAA